MLIEYRLKNYRCFKDEQVLSMIASSDNSNLSNLFSSPINNKINLLKTVAIYGANASGKTKLLESLNFLDGFVSNSFQRKPNSSIFVAPFLYDDESKKNPTEFEVTFVQNNIRYQYGFSVNQTKVLNEWLYSWPKGRLAVFFERTFDSLLDEYKYKFGDLFRGEKERIKDSTRPNALFLSTGAFLNHDQLRSVYDWFLDGLHGFSSNNIPLEYVTKIISQEKYKKKILEFLQIADIQIDDYEVQEEKFPIPSEMPEKYRKILNELYEAGPEPKKTRVNVIRKNQIGDYFSLDLEKDESEGTKRFFTLIAEIFIAFEKPGVFYIDELDSSFHPLLTREIINLFQNSEINCNNVQLIFNTHDTTLLEQDLFRRDQIWFVEKKADMTSELYSLAEFNPRKNELLAKGYLQGRYGAIPFIGDVEFISTNKGC